MNNNILLLGYAREGSTRVKNKMIQPFGNTTLFDLYMEKFYYIATNKEHPFSNIIVAIGESDRTLWKKAKSWEKSSNKHLKIINRSDYSINASITDDCAKVYHYLKDFDEEYVMWVNGCFPFLKEDTIIKVANYFKENNLNGLHCVKSVYNWIWNPRTGLLINRENARKISTVHFEPYFESVHCFHIYKRKYLLKRNSYWSFKKDNPYLYEIKDGIEFMDIDTQEDFDRCKYVYNMGNGES